MSSYRSIHQIAAPGADRSDRRKHILPTYIIGLILIISAISAIVLQPQQASASTRMPNDDCSNNVTATCDGNIISKSCDSNNVIAMSVLLSTNNVHLICYGGALTSKETHGHNGGTVTFNPPILVNALNPDNWSGYLTTSIGTVPFYNNEPPHVFDPKTYIVVKTLVVSDDSI